MQGGRGCRSLRDRLRLYHMKSSPIFLLSLHENYYSLVHVSILFLLFYDFLPNFLRVGHYSMVFRFTYYNKIKAINHRANRLSHNNAHSLTNKKYRQLSNLDENPRRFVSPWAWPRYSSCTLSSAKRPPHFLRRPTWRWSTSGSSSALSYSSLSSWSTS